MTASNIIGIALAVFVLVFLVSAVLYWFKKPWLSKRVLNWSTIIIFTLIALLIIALWSEGNLFPQKPVIHYF